MVSIHRPRGYGPRALPLRHAACDCRVKILNVKLTLKMFMKAFRNQYNIGYIYEINHFKNTIKIFKTDEILKTPVKKICLSNNFDSVDGFTFTHQTQRHIRRI